MFLERPCTSANVFFTETRFYCFTIDSNQAALFDVVIVLTNLAYVCDNLRHTLVTRGALEALLLIAPRCHDPTALWCIAAALHYLAQDERNLRVMAESGTTRVLCDMALQRVEGANPNSDMQQQWRK